ncbi:hypothetical protein, partial [Marinobacter sp. ELB17]|uniref:hypothetical protein n=1 Tax=Marinobacter sp. ELB17 TaxID=270374 RepID=UPI0000F38BFE
MPKADIFYVFTSPILDHREDPPLPGQHDDLVGGIYADLISAKGCLNLCRGQIEDDNIRAAHKYGVIYTPEMAKEPKNKDLFTDPDSYQIFTLQVELPEQWDVRQYLESDYMYLPNLSPIKAVCEMCSNLYVSGKRIMNEEAPEYPASALSSSCP